MFTLHKYSPDRDHPGGRPQTAAAGSKNGKKSSSDEENHTTPEPNSILLGHSSPRRLSYRIRDHSSAHA